MGVDSVQREVNWALILLSINFKKTSFYHLRNTPSFPQALKLKHPFLSCFLVGFDEFSDFEAPGAGASWPKTTMMTRNKARNTDFNILKALKSRNVFCNEFKDNALGVLQVIMITSLVSRCQFGKGEREREKREERRQLCISASWQ
jgi:hypothetical protein